MEFCEIFTAYFIYRKKNFQLSEQMSRPGVEPGTLACKIGALPIKLSGRTQLINNFDRSIFWQKTGLSRRQYKRISARNEALLNNENDVYISSNLLIA